MIKKNTSKEKHKLLLDPVFPKRQHTVKNTDLKKDGIGLNKSDLPKKPPVLSSHSVDRVSNNEQKQISSAKPKATATFDATTTNFPSLASAMESKRIVQPTSTVIVESDPDIKSSGSSSVITKIRNSVMGLIPTPPPSGKKTKKVTLFDMILIGTSDKEAKNIAALKSRELSKSQSAMPSADHTEVSHIVSKKKKKKRLSSLKKKLIQVHCFY